MFNIINPYSKSFSYLSQDEIIVNLRLIKNRIMLKEFKDIYHKSDKNLERYNKAEELDFWLGLKSSKKYSPEQLVLFISNPQEFGKV